MSFQTRILSTLKTSSRQQVSSMPELYRFMRHDAKRYPFLLSSSANRQDNTQYDILIANPLYQLTLDSDRTLRCSDDEVKLESGFFATLDTLWQIDRTDSVAVPVLVTEKTDIPFKGGWFVYLAYEMAEEIEPCLSLPTLPHEQPLAVAARCPAAIVLDKKNNQLIAVAEDAYAYLLDKLEQDYLSIIDTIETDRDESQSSTDVAVSELSEAETFSLASLIESDPADYLRQVEKIKRYIFEGDIFQANLSRQWQAALTKDVADIDLFKALSIQNPSSFAALACLENMTIISSSPERLVSVRNGQVETRPIAGTRPRDDDRKNDKALAKELLAHPKEQAEHIMLIDLERNDLGRVCQPGSIEVNELMVLESWEHVHHIVSNVRGQLRDDQSPVDVLRAVFPGGTITGCPKVHCIEILAEMEKQARGAYTGSLGYINNDGSMDFNILIRTIVRSKASLNNASQNLASQNSASQNTVNNKITFRAGGGIVCDSIAENELEETRAKAKGLLKIFDTISECRSHVDPE